MIVRCRARGVWVNTKEVIPVVTAPPVPLFFAQASAPTLYSRFVAFEKQHGDREGIEQVVVSKRRWVGVGVKTQGVVRACTAIGGTTSRW